MNGLQDVMTIMQNNRAHKFSPTTSALQEVREFVKNNSINNVPTYTLMNLIENDLTTKINIAFCFSTGAASPSGHFSISTKRHLHTRSAQGVSKQRKT
jgi:hypothetical protein